MKHKLGRCKAADAKAVRERSEPDHALPAARPEAQTDAARCLSLELEIEEHRDIVELSEQLLEAWDEGGTTELELIGPPERIEHIRQILCELRRTFFERQKAPIEKDTQ